MPAFPGQPMTQTMPSRAAMMRWIAPVGGAVAALAVVLLFVGLPATVLEDWVWRSGLPSLIGAAEPPLGTTARAVLALAGGALAGAVIWSALFLLFGPGGLLAPAPPPAMASPSCAAPMRTLTRLRAVRCRLRIWRMTTTRCLRAPSPARRPHRRRSNSRFRRTSTCRSPPSTPVRCPPCR
ncbi:hypothetical protein [Sphingomonas melonis]|uniref:hypothetical protein n=1 Tax=Sphingomonas melonis TaxID=152682 RepID=UPI001F163A93|nr:hypothetical protein [Sphingomonas melonis]